MDSEVRETGRIDILNDQQKDRQSTYASTILWDLYDPDWYMCVQNIKLESEKYFFNFYLIPNILKDTILDAVN